MSKRNSTGASNTLFNYFSKTPPANKKLKNGGDAENSPKMNSSSSQKESKIESKYAVSLRYQMNLKPLRRF